MDSLTNYLLVLISILVFAGYLAYVRRYTYMPLKSLSESYYLLPTKTRFLFTIFTWFLAIPIMIAGLNQTGSIFMFLAGAGVCFAGTAAAFREKDVYIVHMSGAIIGILGILLAGAFAYKYPLFSIIYIIILMIFSVLSQLKIKANYFYWLEIIAILYSYFLILNYK